MENCCFPENEDKFWYIAVLLFFTFFPKSPQSVVAIGISTPYLIAYLLHCLTNSARFNPCVVSAKTSAAYDINTSGNLFVLIIVHSLYLLSAP